jgi:hypothetical protein
MNLRFKEWLKVNEDSPSGRAKRAAALLSTQPTIPDAAINSRATAPEWMKEKILKRNHCKKKKD